MATLTVADNNISCEMEHSGSYCLVKDSTKPEKCTNEESQVTPIPREVCDAVFHQLHDDLRKWLNVHEIYPFLYSRNLLTTLEESYLTDQRLTPEAKVDTIISWLPKCDQADYLTPFVAGLRESSKIAGVAHTQLADDLERLCQNELKRVKAKSENHADANTVLNHAALINVVGNEDSNSERGHPNYLRRSRWKDPKVLKTLVLATITVLIISILWIIVTCLFAIVIPKILGDQSERVYGSATIAIMSHVDEKWLSSIDVQIKGEDSSKCNGEIAVVIGKDCSNLSVVRNNAVGGEGSPLPAPCHLYMLAGSSFNITLPNNGNISSFNIWFTHTLESRVVLDELITAGKLNNANRCSHPPQQSSCFFAREYLERPLIFNVTKPGYYCYHLINPDKSPPNLGPTAYGIQWSSSQLTYDFDAIIEGDSTDFGPPQTIQDGEIASIKVSRSFDFSKPYCALLDFKCSSFGTVSDPKRRSDIILLIFFVYLACVVLSLLFVAFGVIAYLKLKSLRCVHSTS